MTRIYRIKPAEGYEFVNTVDSLGFDTFRSFDGTSRKENWVPVSVCLVRSDKGVGFKKADFHIIGGDPLIMRRNAVELLNEILCANGEILPLEEKNGADILVFNSRAVAALNEPRSEIIRFPNSKKIMDIKKYAFFQSKLKDVNIFHLPGSPHITYVDQSFVDNVNDASLVGLTFDLIWHSK